MSPGITRRSHRFVRHPLASSMIAVGLLVGTVAGCGSDESADSTAATASQGSTTGSTEGGGSAPGSDGSVGPDTEGVSFDGKAKMEIGTDWVEIPTNAELVAWQVAEPADDFTPNVNLMSLKAGGVDLEKYGRVTNKQYEKSGATIVDSGTLTGKDDRKLFYTEYTADYGEGPLHFFAMITVRGDVAAVATLSTTESTFNDINVKVRPYLESLEILD